MSPGGEPLDEIGSGELRALLDQGVELFDVRGADERAAGMLPGAKAAGADELPGLLAPHGRKPAGTVPVVVYCASGVRSRAAVDRLRAAGIPARSLAGGIRAWQAAGLPVIAGTSALSAREIERYARQIRLPEVGLAGQERLARSRVLCIGAGGLGSPVALYLAAAGVGDLGLVDGDVVELSNLHRQILHTTAALGRPKVESAAAAVAALNPHVRVRAIRERLGPANAGALLAGYDVIVDGSDNFATRYLVNDVALGIGTPVVHAAIQGFEGQVAVFAARGAPCYRCLFPAPPPAEFAPSCADAGVLGVLPGVLGTLQATEALKLLLGLGTPLAGRLLLFDALSMSFREMAVAADPACACARPSG